MMDSTPATGNASSVEPSRALIATQAEYRQAVQTLIAAARSTIHIFDADGVQLDLNSPRRIDALKAFVRGNTEAKIVVVVRSIAHIEKQCPRFIQFVALHGNQTAVYLADGDAARVEDCFILIDDSHFARRTVQSHPRGVVNFRDQHAAAPMIERFQEILGAATVVSLSTTIGL
jgi:hypothetical protein